MDSMSTIVFDRVATLGMIFFKIFQSVTPKVSAKIVRIDGIWSRLAMGKSLIHMNLYWLLNRWALPCGDMNFIT
jgi:hypothetical protein